MKENDNEYNEVERDLATIDESEVEARLAALDFLTTTRDDEDPTRPMTINPVYVSLVCENAITFGDDEDVNARFRRRHFYPLCPNCGEEHDRSRITCEQLDAIRDAERDAGWPSL